MISLNKIQQCSGDTNAASCKEEQPKFPGGATSRQPNWLHPRLLQLEAGSKNQVVPSQMK